MTVTTEPCPPVPRPLPSLFHMPWVFNSSLALRLSGQDQVCPGSLGPTELAEGEFKRPMATESCLPTHTHCDTELLALPLG